MCRRCRTRKPVGPVWVAASAALQHKRRTPWGIQRRPARGASARACDGARALGRQPEPSHLLQTCCRLLSSQATGYALRKWLHGALRGLVHTTQERRRPRQNHRGHKLLHQDLMKRGNHVQRPALRTLLRTLESPSHLHSHDDTSMSCDAVRTGGRSRSWGVASVKHGEQG